MTPLLITRSDFAGRAELSANIADAKINNRILEAQDFDLRGLMGDAFYYAFVNTFPDNPGAANLALLNGGSYTVKDITHYSDGLKPVLVYFALSRLLKQLDTHLTPNGVMIKRNEFSDHLDTRQIEFQSKQFNSQALAYWERCEKFLDFKKADYPLWKANECGSDGRSNTATKIHAVGGCDNYNVPYYGYRRG
jgi:hypothetical protein